MHIFSEDVMATTCDKCGSHDFVLAQTEPRKLQLDFDVLRCASCGNVVGLFDDIKMEDIPSRRREFINSLLKKVNHLDHR